MAREVCPRHGKDYPCTCAMGNIYRFVEPVILLMLREKGHSYGYDLATTLKEHALTDAEIEGASLYRTLRRLETNGHVRSSWDVEGGGPARRVYSLTKNGVEHLEEWRQVLDHLSKAMARFVRKAQKANGKTPRAVSTGKTRRAKASEAAR